MRVESGAWAYASVHPGRVMGASPEPGLGGRQQRNPAREAVEDMAFSLCAHKTSQDSSPGQSVQRLVTASFPSQTAMAPTGEGG